MVTSIPYLIAEITDDNDFFKLKEIANIHDDWQLEYDKAELKIWSKSVPNGIIKMIKVWSVFSGVSSTDLYNTLLDPHYRRKWDTYMLMGYDIGYLSPNNLVCYYAVSVPALRSRDFVLQSSWLDRGTEHYILNHSICHKDHPPRQGFIRAVSYFTGYFIKCIPNLGCEFYFVSQTDPQGNIPAWLVNKCTQIFAPKFVKHLEKAAYAYNDWKVLNDPYYLPWVHPEQIKCPKIMVQDCVPSDEEVKSQFFQNLTRRIKTPTAEYSQSDVEGKEYSLNSAVAIPGPSKMPNSTSENEKNQEILDEFQIPNDNKKGGSKKRSNIFVHSNASKTPLAATDLVDEKLQFKYSYKKRI